MKQLIYTFRYLFRSRGNNLIKVISLTLGLVVGLVLFSQVAFELSFDKFYPDSNRLYNIQRKISITQGDGFKYDGPVLNAPVPGAMRDEMHEVEEAVVIGYSQDEMQLLSGDKLYRERVCIADSSFFDLFGIRLIEGDKSNLALSSHLFLSQSAARRIFGMDNPVGKTLLLNKKESVTVAGVFEDIPDNCHLHYEAVLSFKTLTEVWGMNPGWMNNDAYCGYVKLAPGVTPQEVEAKIPDMLRKYYDVDAMKKRGVVFEYYLKPIQEMHSGEPTVQRMIYILSLLAFSLLFVSAMNYVLISISSLAVRAKSVGVHKCNGASEGNIFAMFLYETMALIGVALFFSLFLILIFRTSIETLIQTSLSNLFSWSNLWVVVGVVAGLLLAAGVIPARIFSSIPVTQVFRTYTTNKREWKRVLLFIQFTGIAFMLTLLLIIVKQYDMVMDKDLGYTTEHVIFTQDIGDISGEQMVRLKTEFGRMPEVVKASVASNIPIQFLNGSAISEEGGETTLFSSRGMSMDKDYLETFQIELVEGTNFAESKVDYTHAIVNETFVKKMHWEGPAVGKVFLMGKTKIEVTGVVKDFQLQTLRDEMAPCFIYPQGEGEGTWTGKSLLILRLNDTHPALLAEMNKKLRALLNNEDAYFADYRSRIDESYKDARLFRDSILVASVIMLIITLLGLLGYTEDEIHRRSKEIAIRKVNGATAWDVLVVISKDITVTALPAVVIGMGVAYKIGADWLMQFAVKTPLSADLFVFSGLAVLAVIVGCVALRAWNVANENPVTSIKSE